MSLLKTSILIIVGLVALYVLAFLTGCASITPNRDSNGNIVSVEAKKFMSDLAYKQILEYATDGKTVIKRTEEFETKTNVDKIVDSTNTLLGTVVDGAGKLMP